MFSTMLQLHTHIAQLGDGVLSMVLMGTALVLFCISLVKGHEVFKAMVLTWVLLP